MLCRFYMDGVEIRGLESSPGTRGDACSDAQSADIGFPVGQSQSQESRKAGLQKLVARESSSVGIWHDSSLTPPTWSFSAACDNGVICSLFGVSTFAPSCSSTLTISA